MPWVEAIGYGFFPTFMGIAFGVLFRSCPVRFGRHGIPAAKRTLLNAISAASASLSSGPTNADTATAFNLNQPIDNNAFSRICPLRLLVALRVA